MSHQHPLTTRRAFACALCCVLAFGVAAQAGVELTIDAPASGETLHDNEGRVPVTVSIRGLPAGTAPRLRPLVDGAAQGPDRRARTFSLEGVDRGEHVLVVQLIDARGGVIAASPPVTFHLWRASALFPARRDPAGRRTGP